jgi:hypothetical protein
MGKIMTTRMIKEGRAPKGAWQTKGHFRLDKKIWLETLKEISIAQIAAAGDR